MIAKVEDPMKIAKVYERILKTTGNIEERDKFLQEEASKLFTGAWKALQQNDLKKCECFIEGVEFCHKKKFRIASELQMARLKLTLAKRQDKPVNHVNMIRGVVYRELKAEKQDE